MFEEELARYDSQSIKKGPNPEDNVRPVVEPVKDEHEDITGETLAAGVMGNLLNEVVYILEGDKESDTTPEIRIENGAEPPNPNQTVNPNTGAKPEVLTETSNAEANKALFNAEANGENSTNANGEVLARMPETRTQDSQNNSENNSKSFENGNPSPLENTNDTKVSGQNEKAYSDAAEAVKNAAENTTEISTNEMTAPPPLSEGIRPEQFMATQQMTEAALNTPVRTENLFEEMISRVEMMQNDTKTAMTIQLNPEFLGKVALEVAVDAAGLHVKINAEDSGVRSMINGQLTALIESLENKGIEIAEVEVIYTGVNNGAFKEPGEGQQEQSRHYKPANREVNSTDGVAYYTALPDLLDYYLDAGVSSVEYRA